VRLGGLQLRDHVTVDVPGGLNNITGNDGKKYPVQSLWSNESAGGTGYCAGADDNFARHRLAPTKRGESPAWRRVRPGFRAPELRFWLSAQRQMWY